MKAVAQEMSSRKSRATGAALQKVVSGFASFKAGVADRFQYAVCAFHDTIESRKFLAAEALRLSQVPEAAEEDFRVAALLLCTTSTRVISLREGLNHFTVSDVGVQPTTREEYLRSQPSHAWEMKVEGDRVQVWTTADTQATSASTNDLVTALNGSFFVKVIPFELRGSLQ